MTSDPAFDAKLAAKKLLREARSGALATLMLNNGDPYCSLVNVATDASGAPLMLDERKAGDPLQGARVMLMGTADRTDRGDVRTAYLRRQIEAEQFVNFA